MKWKDSFHPYAVITILFWSLALVFTRLALRYFSAFPLGFLRYLAASLALVIVAAVAKMERPDKADVKWFLASGALGFFLYMIAFNKGSETITAATASVILATAPVLTAGLASFVYKERLSFVQWLAIAVEFCGVALITLMQGALSLNHGLLWLFLAVIALSFYNLFQRGLTKRYSGLQACTYSMFAGTILLAAFAPSALREARGAPPLQWLYVAVLGVFCSALAYVTWAEAFKKAKLASQVGNYMFLTPFLTSLLGFLLADEIPDPPTLMGGAVILLGMLLFNFEGRISALLRLKKTTP